MNKLIFTHIAPFGCRVFPFVQEFFFEQEPKFIEGIIKKETSVIGDVWRRCDFTGKLIIPVTEWQLDFLTQLPLYSDVKINSGKYGLFAIRDITFGITWTGRTPVIEFEFNVDNLIAGICDTPKRLTGIEDGLGYTSTLNSIVDFMQDDDPRFIAPLSNGMSADNNVIIYSGQDANDNYLTPTYYTLVNGEWEEKDMVNYDVFADSTGKVWTYDGNKIMPIAQVLTAVYNADGYDVTGEGVTGTFVELQWKLHADVNWTVEDSVTIEAFMNAGLHIVCAEVDIDLRSRIWIWGLEIGYAETLIIQS
jgi:hypothetical protein